jgi:hypothetical protein
MNVHSLPDLRLLDAKAALEAITDRARKLRVFGAAVRFDEPIWISPTSSARARPRNKHGACSTPAKSPAVPEAWRAASRFRRTLPTSSSR